MAQPDDRRVYKDSYQGSQLKPESIQRVLTHGYAFDTETHLFQPGLTAPPLVCASVGRDDNGQLLDPEQALLVFQSIIEHATYIGANCPFDMLVMAVYGAMQGLDLMPPIFQAYDEERVYDVLLSEQLHALACGHLGTFPDESRFPRNKETGKAQSYNLDIVTQLVLGRTNAKANDTWRKSYALLQDIPIAEWPDDARTYPIDDVINPSEIAVVQVGRNRNLHNLAFQAYADWCLRLGAAWGFTVDPPYIADLKIKTEAAKLKGQGKFLGLGILKTVKEKGELVIKKDTASFKKKIADAHGCNGVCNTCHGWGKVPGATRCPKSKCGGELCETCRGTGYKPKGCKGCDGTGYDLDSVPMSRTKTGLVAGGRDALYETGDEDLIDFAAWGEQDKILTTYIPWLERGIAEDGTVIPLNPRPTVLKETGRLGASTEHQLPREGGVREAIVARPGWVLGSCDWSSAELITHAQSCLYIVGWSKMAEALNAGIKVHDQLGAKIGGVTYEAMLNRGDDELLGNYRQAAKPPNFGFPGLMGAPTLCLQQRKQGPDTTAPNGRVYKGLRFCILAGGAQECGVQKITEWKGRPISPTCLACVQTAADIRDVWLETWPENVPYFEFVKMVHATGEMTQHWSKRIRAGMTLCATANGFFQGFAGDMMKLALCRITKEMYAVKSSDLYGVRPIIPIHDELLFEAREAQASAAAKRVSVIMVGVMKELCPDLAAAAEAEPALMRRLSKGAKPVYDEYGNLIPWEPKKKAA